MPGQLFLPLTELDEAFSLDSLQECFLDDIRFRPSQGVDRMSASVFANNLAENLELVHRKALGGRYEFTPYAELLRPKGRAKAPRVISLPTIRDKLTLARLKDCLHQLLANCVERRPPNAHIRNLKSMIIAHQTACFIRADITAFYDSILHDRLLGLLRKKWTDERGIQLVARALRTPTVPIGTARPSETAPRGVPQGLPISNVLANLYLEEFDKTVSGMGLFYNRYVDDILVLVPPSRLDGILKFMVDYLAQIGLEMNPEKSSSGSVLTPLEYLGYHFESGTVAVRKSSVDKFLARIAGMVARFRKAHPSGAPNAAWTRLAWDLNERIAGAISGTHQYGWIFYFLEIDDMTLLHSMDAVIHGFVTRLGNAPPTFKLKRLVRAIYEARHNRSGGYIHNYDAYRTPAQKADFLVALGYWDPNMAASASLEDVLEAFGRVRTERTSLLDRDVGFIS